MLHATSKLWILLTTPLSFSIFLEFILNCISLHNSYLVTSFFFFFLLPSLQWNTVLNILIYWTKMKKTVRSLSVQDKCTQHENLIYHCFISLVPGNRVTFWHCPQGFFFPLQKWEYGRKQWSFKSEYFCVFLLCS